MNKKIDWFLFKNNDIILNYENIDCNIKNNKYIVKDDYGTHTVDIDNKKYLKENDESKMTIDFINKHCILDISNLDTLSFDIDCNMKILNEKVEMIYKFDEESFKLIIKIKGDRNERKNK